MTIRKKIFIVFVLLCVSAAAAYSQDCNSYLRTATELVSQNKYCEAKKYYQNYSKCNANADVSSDIAMCERRCKIQGAEGGENETVNKTEWEDKPATENKPSDNRKVKSETSKSGFRGFHLHAGVFLPLSDFADYDKREGPETGSGYAGIGFNLGFKVYIPISRARGLSCFLGADAFYNGTKSKFKKNIGDEEEEEEEVSDYKFRYPSYLNIPVTAGVNYAYAINNKISIYGEVAAGLNLSKHIGYKYSYSYSGEGSSFSYTQKWKMAAGFTGGLEAGILLVNKISIGIRYQHFGSYKYKGKVVYEYEYDGESGNESEDIKFDKKLSISGISIKLGILF